MSDLLDDVVAAAGLTVFGAAPAAGPVGAGPPLTGRLPDAALAARIDALRAELRAQGLDTVVLCATGAAAAAAAAIARTLGLRLTVLDAADPHRARSALADRLDRTVVVLAAASGPAVETDAYRRAYLQAFEDAGLHDVGRRFVVVTAPGSPLETLARETGAELFRTGDAPESALSAYALVAAGLAGADTATLLAEAAALLTPPPAVHAAAGFAMAPPARQAEQGATARPEPHPEDGARAPGIALGDAIAAAAHEGRDKLAVAPDGTGIDGLGEWIERLFAVLAPRVVPVPLENPSSWGHEGPDVLSVTVGGALGMGLMPGGGIAPDLSVNGPLGAQLLAWEQAARVSGARPQTGAETGRVPGPGHDDERTLGILEAGPPAETPALVEGAVEVYGETSATTLIGAIDALVHGVPAGGHVAVAAYLDRDGDAAAAGVRDALAGRVARAVTFGWGSLAPRPGLGAILQITGAVTADVRVPGRPYTFGELQAARAAGGRGAVPLLRLHLTDRATGIEQLLAALGG
ncbi:glucose-6-phosphate isomerase [Dactylosporangium sp. NPDC048998]|uniref:glucose-6-phosphate isomerase n=1 Tax=Dactylosporangium sp. NPDC048998 TaxID=3363976 RepID=UPI0037111214